MEHKKPMGGAPSHEQAGRIEALEAAVLMLHERLVDAEACCQEALSCLKLAAQVQERTQAQIEALTGRKAASRPVPGGLVQ